MLRDVRGGGAPRTRIRDRTRRLRKRPEVAELVADLCLNLVGVIDHAADLPDNLTRTMQLPRDLVAGSLTPRRLALTTARGRWVPSWRAASWCRDCSSARNAPDSEPSPE